MGNHPVRGATREKKENERKKPTGIMGYNEKKQYSHYGNSRKRRERERNRKYT